MDAAERLRARKRFVEYYLRMAEEAGADLAGTGAARMALWLEKEYPNLCAALACCQEDPEQAATGLKLADSLRKYWEVRGYPGEGQALLLGAAVWGDRAERTTARADALKRAGDSAYQSGNLSAAKARHQEALSINRELGDRARQAINLNNLGNVARSENDHAAAQRMHEEALALNREVGDQRREAVNLHNIGNAHRDQGSLDKARERYEEAITLNEKIADHLGIGHNLNSLARLAFGRDDRNEALRLYEKALTHFRTAGNQAWIAHNLAEIEKLQLRSALAGVS
jgi:tetratricopeptide (TPR) repeat protein